MRNSHLDLTGARAYINTVVKYSCPEYAVCWNMYANSYFLAQTHSTLAHSHRPELGERFVTSVVTRPGIAKVLPSMSHLKGWRFGGEVETLLSNGELQLNRISVGLQKKFEAEEEEEEGEHQGVRGGGTSKSSPVTGIKGKIDFINGLSQSYNIAVSLDRESAVPRSLTNGENRLGIGLTAQTSLMASGIRIGPAKSVQVGLRVSWA